MKRTFTFFFLITCLFVVNSFSQTSPDYIFGNDNGAGWNWSTGTQGTASLGSSYKWQFQANASGNHYFKFGETSSSADGSGFWVNNASGDLQYTGAGDMWIAYYYSNMGDGGAIYTAITNGNYYVIKTKIYFNNSNFAVFDNGTTVPVTLTAITKNLSGSTLNVDVTASGSKGTNEKIWVRYTTNNWTTSSTVEASSDQGSNVWRAAIPYTSGQVVEYYAYTTIQRSSAPAENDADFYTINYINNSGKNYMFAVINGSYYIGNNGTGIGGGNPHFNSLKEACDLINVSSITGNSSFSFTSNLTEASNVGLGKNPEPYIITFTAYNGFNNIQPVITFTQTTDNTGASGGWVIGCPDLTVSSTSNYGLVSMRNIIIDGSNTQGGTTRDLTFQTNSTCHSNTYPIRIIGDVNNVIIRNCIVTANQSVSYGLLITNRNDATLGNWTPDSITVDNCEVTNIVSGTGQAIAISNSGTPTTFPTEITFMGNKITAKTRGIFLNYAGNTRICNNEFYINQTLTGYLSYGVWAYVIGSTTQPNQTVHIYDNFFKQLSTINSNAGDYGIIGIYVNSRGTYNVYNNVITGFDWTGSAANPNCVFEGIRVATSLTDGITANIYNNSVYIKDLPLGLNGTGTKNVKAFSLNISGASGTRVCNVSNNVFSSDEQDFATYAYFWSNTSIPTVSSNYNNLYVSNPLSYIGRYGATDCPDLSSWQTISGKDNYSLSGNPGFTSATNLQPDVTNSNCWNLNGFGTPIFTVPFDILGNSRSTSVTTGATDIGAYEFTPTSNPPAPTLSGSIGVGNTQTITLSGRTIGSITWTGGTALPTSLIIQYKPGTDPKFPSGNYSNAHWNICQSGGTDFTYDLTLNYVPNILGTIGNESDIRLASIPHSCTLDNDDPVPMWIHYETSVVNTTNKTISMSGLTSFSQFALSDNNNPMPVELITFEASVSGKIVNILWKTVTENNSSKFIVEKNSDGKWITLGEVKAAGISNSLKKYSFTDRNVIAGKNLYRLKMIDNDGSFSYSKEIEIEMTLPKTFELSQNYPNPFNPNTRITYSIPVDSKVKLLIYSVNGELVKTLVDENQSAGNYTITFDAGNLASGTYIYRLIANDYISTKKMILMK